MANTSPLIRSFLGFVILCGCTMSIAAQSNAPTASTDEQVRLLRDEVRELRAEVASLRQELHTSASNAPPQTTATAPAIPATDKQNDKQEEIAANVDMLQSQVQQLAQTKVESNSKFTVRLYGTILSTTFLNTRDIDWADEPTVGTANSGVYRAGSFSSSLRQSRIGLLIDGPTIGPFKTSGVFALDFSGGQTDFRATPLFGLANIVYAYARLESPKTVIEAGQDEMILAPQNPTSLVALSYPDLYQAGNLYIRSPQLRVEQLLVGSKEGRQAKLAVGLVAPIATYPALNYPGGDIGNSWLRPALQARLSFRSGLQDSAKSGWQFGFSGHYGRPNFPVADKSGNVISSFTATSWAGAFDFDAHYRRFGIGGEGYIGSNLQSLGGGIGQQGPTRGGFVEGRFHATPRLQFDAGVGNDKLVHPDRIVVLVNRNSAVFANTIFHFTPEFGVSLEYRRMVTRLFDGRIWRNNNVDLGVAYSF